MSDRLVLVVAPRYQGTLGFGDVFDADVRRVVEGDLADERIQITVMAGDERGAFLREQRGDVEIAFRLNGRDEPYARMPITGFVDSSRRSWVVESMKD